MLRLWSVLVLVGACGSAPAATHAAPAVVPTPPAEQAPVAPQATCTLGLATTIFGGPTEVHGEGATHSEACRAAALSVPEEQRRNVQSVDGIYPLWIVSPADDTLPEATPGAPPSTCELEVAFDDGPSAEGTGEAESEPAAVAAAVAQACATLGEATCGPPAFLTSVVRRESSLHWANGVSTTSHRVDVRLQRVRTRAATASSDLSRAHACRDAYRQACEGICPDGTSHLVMLDGVALE